MAGEIVEAQKLMADGPGDKVQARTEAEQIASGTDRTGILMYPNRVDTSGR